MAASVHPCSLLTISKTFSPLNGGLGHQRSLALMRVSIERLILQVPRGRAETAETCTTVESFLGKKGHEVF